MYDRQTDRQIVDRSIFRKENVRKDCYCKITLLKYTPTRVNYISFSKLIGCICVIFIGVCIKCIYIYIF